MYNNARFEIIFLLFNFKYYMFEFSITLNRSLCRYTVQVYDKPLLSYQHFYKIILKEHFFNNFIKKN
jgi:hypothetical protein